MRGGKEKHRGQVTENRELGTVQYQIALNDSVKRCHIRR